MTPIFLSTIGRSLQKTLDTINDDDTDGSESGADFTKYCDVEEMNKAFVDELEMGGPGLASEVDEGTELPTGAIYEGYVTRFIARKIGLRLIVTEEAMEDGQYEEAINAGGRIKRAIWKTVDIDAANMYNRMFNTSYVGGDDQPLGSSSHTLPGGGTFSNQATTAFSPSIAAVIVGRQAVAIYPGHDGVREGYTLEAVHFPISQQSVWETVTMSPGDPNTPNQTINVAKNLGLKLVPIRHWTASDTNYAFRTSSKDGGLKFKWRRRPKARTWVDNSQEFMNHSNSCRIARGWSDPRGHFCVNA